MIARRLTSILKKRLSQTPVVALLGSRQVGKTTLARGLDVGKPCHYLDMERPSDVAKLADPELLQQSSETLAGRISYLELDPLNLTELGTGDDVMDRHWFRGGYRQEAYAAVLDLLARPGNVECDFFAGDGGSPWGRLVGITMKRVINS